MLTLPSSPKSSPRPISPYWGRISVTIWGLCIRELRDGRSRVRWWISIALMGVASLSIGMLLRLGRRMRRILWRCFEQRSRAGMACVVMIEGCLFWCTGPEIFDLWGNWREEVIYLFIYFFWLALAIMIGFGLLSHYGSGHHHDAGNVKW